MTRTEQRVTFFVLVQFYLFWGFVFLSDVASVLVDLFYVGKMRSDKRMEGLPVSDSVTVSPLLDNVVMRGGQIPWEAIGARDYDNYGDLGRFHFMLSAHNLSEIKR